MKRVCITVIRDYDVEGAEDVDLLAEDDQGDFYLESVREHE